MAAAIVMLTAPSAAWAAPTTQVVQGEVLRLVSVADWDAAANLLPGQPVLWDVAVSAQAPDPGVVEIGISATGGASLLLDVTRCDQPWQSAGCPGDETTLRSAWPVPRDGIDVPLVSMRDTDTAHLRLAISIDGADVGSTRVTVHAQGAGESVEVGPGGGDLTTPAGLATTGLAPFTPWLIGSGAALAAGGLILAARRRRGPAGEPR